MLHLPTGWPTYTTAYVVEQIMRQADALGLYADAARAMTRAAIGYMLSAPRWVNRADRMTLLPHPMGWMINDWLFHVLPGSNADALAALRSLPRFKCDVDLIVPPRTESHMMSAVTAMLPDGHVDICPIDSFVCTRVLWTSLDLAQSSREGLVDVLRRYQRLVRTIPALHVDVDCEVPAIRENPKLD